MSKAEKFIIGHTKDCSNEMESPLYAHPKLNFYSWLTPDQARKAVEIAREETTEKMKQFLKENYLVKSIEPLRWVSWEKVFYDLKQAMKDE